LFFERPRLGAHDCCECVAICGQILDKLNFFKLGENLPRILFDYAEKRANTANATFKRAC
jgi:hypothetical protein